MIKIILGFEKADSCPGYWLIWYTGERLKNCMLPNGKIFLSSLIAYPIWDWIKDNLKSTPDIKVEFLDSLLSK